MDFKLSDKKMMAQVRVYGRRAHLPAVLTLQRAEGQAWLPLPSLIHERPEQHQLRPQQAQPHDGHVQLLTGLLAASLTQQSVVDSQDLVLPQVASLQAAPLSSAAQ